jgi:hypothetical protein
MGQEPLRARCILHAYGKLFLLVAQRIAGQLKKSRKKRPFFQRSFEISKNY